MLVYFRRQKQKHLTGKTKISAVREIYCPMNKNFGLTTLQDVLHVISTKHISNRSKANKNLVQYFKFSKLIDRLTLDYFRTL